MTIATSIVKQGQLCSGCKYAARYFFPSSLYNCRTKYTCDGAVWIIEWVVKTELYYILSSLVLIKIIFIFLNNSSKYEWLFIYLYSYNCRFSIFMNVYEEIEPKYIYYTLHNKYFRYFMFSSIACCGFFSTSNFL